MVPIFLAETVHSPSEFTTIQRGSDRATSSSTTEEVMKAWALHRQPHLLVSRMDRSRHDKLWSTFYRRLLSHFRSSFWHGRLWITAIWYVLLANIPHCTFRPLPLILSSARHTLMPHWPSPRWYSLSQSRSLSQVHFDRCGTPVFSKWTSSSLLALAWPTSSASCHTFSR